MKILRPIPVAVLFALVWAGAALGQSSTLDPTTANTPNRYVSLAADPAQPGTTASPSDRPAQAPAAAPAANGNGNGSNGDEEEKPEPYKLFKLPGLEKHGIDIRGWINAGYTANFDFPANRFNGPVTFNDRANEFQMNQLYMITERVTKTDDCKHWDIGGRVDFLYGTDSRFTADNGLETEWNQSQRFYGASLPQMYTDVAYKDWIVRMGRFYTIVGYENPMATENFFYSHSYTFQYGEPFTNVGVLAKRKLNDQLSFSIGATNGWDQWNDNNDKWGLLGSLTWNLPNDKTSIAMGLVTSNEQVDTQSTRTIFSTVLTHKFTDKLTYVFQNDLAHETNVPGSATWDGVTTGGAWWGLVNYLTYSLNDCWAVGGRYELFTDEVGSRVFINGGRGDAGFPMGPAAPGHWQELSLGVNYKPTLNVMLRSEVRWDWVEPIDSALTGGAFDDQSSRHQVLWGTDLIVKF